MQSICIEDLVKTHAGPMLAASVSIHWQESCLLDSLPWKLISTTIGLDSNYTTENKQRRINPSMTRPDIYAKKHFKHCNCRWLDSSVKTKTWAARTMFPLETSSPISVGREKGNLAEVQEKDFKIPIMIMLRDLEKDMNESLKGSENTSGWMKHWKCFKTWKWNLTQK